MENRPWKERVTSKKHQVLLARGERLARDDKENRKFLKETEDRGGIVNPQKDDDV